MRAAAPGAALVARFRGDLVAVLDRDVAADEPIALAVSGGPDSMAMLALASAAFPGQLIAATVDHRLRAASADEAAMVGDYCQSVGVPHEVLTPDVPIDPANVQAGARAARYDLLTRWAMMAGAGILATAHHSDDQAETFLMRAARGSGVSGLAGIRARVRLVEAPPFDLVRPLLGWRSATLRGLCSAEQVPFVDDPSNGDPRFDRTQFRALLAEAPLLDAVQLARSAAHAAQADSAMRDIEAWLWGTRRILHDGTNPGEAVSLDLTGVPRELKRRLARAAIAAVRSSNAITRPDFGDASNIEALLDALESRKSATHAGVIASSKGPIWHFSKAPPRRSL